MPRGLEYLKFHCTGCGNCCREPLLPLTDDDVARVSEETGELAPEIVRWVDRNGIQMDEEPEAFVRLRQGKRVMVMRQGRGGCRYLGPDDRCRIYSSRPLGCRIFPFNPTFSATGALKRLYLAEITECPYELNGKNSVAAMRTLYGRYDDKRTEYHQKVAEWNRSQLARRRQGKAEQTAKAFLQFLGLPTGAP